MQTTRKKTSGQNTDTESGNIRKNAPEIDHISQANQAWSVSRDKATGGGQ